MSPQDVPTDWFAYLWPVLRIQLDFLHRFIAASFEEA
jgi:hypothetical protein